MDRPNISLIIRSISIIIWFNQLGKTCKSLYTLKILTSNTADPATAPTHCMIM